MSKLSQLIYNSDQLVKFHANIKGTSSSNFSSSILEAYKIELADLWKGVKIAFRACIMELEDDSTDDLVKDVDIETVENKYKNSTDTYLNCLAFILEQLGVVKAKEKGVADDDVQLENVAAELSKRPSEDDNCANKNKPSDTIVMNSQSHVSKSFFKIPPCEVPIFKGDYVSWPTFRDLFQAGYGKHPDLSDVQKLYYLRKSLQEEALQIVCKFPLTNDGYKLAWAALTNTYENKRVLVNQQIKILFNLPQITSEFAKSIKHLQSSINDCKFVLQSLDISIDKWDPILVYACSNKLPHTTLSLWEQSLTNPNDLPTWDQLNNFLTIRYRALEAISDVAGSIKPTSTNRVTNSSGSKRVNVYHSKTNSFSCKVCKQDHLLRLCPEFSKLSPRNRYDIVIKSKCCLNCLASNHLIANCSSKMCCRICNARHHSMLHFDTQTANSSIPAINKTTSDSLSSNIQSTSTLPTNKNTTPANNSLASNVNCHSFHVSTNKCALLATALVKIQFSDSFYQIRALIDPGSEMSFITEKIQKKLQLTTKSSLVSISGLGAESSFQSNKLCNFRILNNSHPGANIFAQAYVVQTISSNLPTQSINMEQILIPTELQLADPTFNTSAAIDLLIGSDLYPLILLNGVKRIGAFLVAQQTIFGWTITGTFAKQAQAFTTRVIPDYDVSLNDKLDKYFALEEVPKLKKFLSPEDIYCEELYKSTTYRDIEGRYVVTLPFRLDFPMKVNIGLSRENALKQYLRTEQNLKRTPDFETKYFEILNEYLSLNHMHQVPGKEKVEEGVVKSYYLNHHAVLKPNSTTTSVRIVYNASKATNNGISLNDILYQGPKLQNDLLSVIFRWRLFKFVFNADISKMYRQIKVNPNQTSFQRVIFRPSENSEVQDYELSTVTFGVNCAPYLALRTLQQLAIDIENAFPDTANRIRTSYYVDDLLSGDHDLQSAIQAQKEIVSLLASAGFELKKWTSNVSELLKTVPSDNLYDENFLNLDEKSTVKTLGLRWNALNDSFSFNLHPKKEIANPTKRQMFSQLACFYDPANWCAPVTISGKILMQHVWSEKTQWDEILSNASLLKWKQFLSNLSDIKNIKIPRWVNYTPQSKIALIGFCDASERAYAASIYIRIETDNQVFCHLLCAKTRLAPLKTISLPRLELCAALLLAQLMKFVLNSWPYKEPNIYLYGDSSIVLAWLDKSPHLWNTFIANRTSQILELVGNLKWSHIRSNENPADLATRGITSKELENSSLWWNGPDWVMFPIDSWPISIPSDISSDCLEIRKTVSYATKCSQDQDEDLVERFSSLTRAIRVFSYVLRFLNATLKKQKFTSHFLSREEIQSTTQLLYRAAQMKYFADEYNSLLRKSLLSRKSTILTLNPFLDSDLVIRSNGRLTNATLSFNERFPIILPYKCHLATLLVDFIHKFTLHGGNALVLRTLRQTFWIPRAKNLVKFRINKCKICVLHKKQTRMQIMAALPKERTNFSRAFTNCGLDFAGPFDLKSFSGRFTRFSKGYVCLFICFATKAIHLEAVSDLSTPMFLAAFDRFCARRGLPSNLYSDNGTNFVGANKELQKNYKDFVKSYHKELSEKFSVHQVSWHFLPPGAPHMGGLWEAGVKSAKLHLKKVASKLVMTYEEFSTLLSKVEACLNSRPLHPLSDKIDDFLPLTPGHFLVGTPLIAPPEPEISNSLSTLNRWNKIKLLNQEFACRWKTEYLLDLQRRYKWKYPQKNLEIGDLVVIKNENLPPTDWKLGRVTDVTSGSDGNIRVAKVITATGELVRPVVKLVNLPS